MATLDGAFRRMKRENFLPDSVVDSAHLDVPLPIGFGQTNSQPSTVRMMLEWLGPQSGDTVLDVGSGSGWTTALLAYVVGTKGYVYGVERIRDLLAFGRENCKRLHINNVKFYAASHVFGLEKCAPYDRILVSASCSNVPKALLSQLKINGKMVIPVQDVIYEITKISNFETDVITHPGFVFVPLVEGAE